MLMLDAFCGEGGATAGYVRAGWRVIGVDNSPARLEVYPEDSHEDDALDFIARYGHMFDAIHASPPCQGYSRGTAAIPDRLDRYDRLIAATREALRATGRPYVIENVPDARPELRDPHLLCGRMFGLTAIDDDGTTLTLDRHRWFESNVPLMVPEHTPHGWKYNRDHGIQVAGVYGGARRDKHEARHVRKGGYVPPSLTVQQALLGGTDWMTEEGCWLSIPPVYTQHIGAQLHERIHDAATA